MVRGEASSSSMPRALSIAGSDSGGGAGIQADLKTFEALGVYGMTVITAITAQNTVGVQAVEGVSPALVRAQLQSVLSDIGVDAIKTGMLLDCGTINVVADTIESSEPAAMAPLVVDPVMVAKSGDRLLAADAVAALKTRLAPLATVLTPNIPEAEQLLGRRLTIDSMDSMRRALVELMEELPETRAVLLKGGHLDSTGNVCVDLFSDRVHGGLTELTLSRLSSRNSHGTGCTTASAIAAGLAKGYPLLKAVYLSKRYVHGCIEHALPLGAGCGPLFHAHLQAADGALDAKLKELIGD
ncbi:phosphomethylpyrimidine kinase [Cyanidioschyzon merolae strain 10D]|uniref:Phosphomethylpyrimidine kinase n=1 Tax=Cyanidioschyzon merolae (strain NIES-3377 / 10D) TaxID=280699 RepID=M1UUG1_CYAM1|nr:phosphomethylpyrimidine kinase [Cyanidioschyzon merolae strain 10D]BAM81496.1 phosphomethylpyrimidine kinase [Cyanidioschyzon merolae strain 10D]|eukprot:XP_005537532.1 phosphomethylpyrimidine kinase [Cyanidioschyzon merolae strain 10D]